MSKLKAAGLTVTGLSLLIATGILFYGGNHQACCTSVGGYNIDWIKSLIGLGGLGSLPALLPKAFAWLRYAANLVPALRGTKVDDRLIGGSEIATYAALVETAGSLEVRAGLVTAGRAACLNMMEDLFPVEPPKSVEPTKPVQS